MMMQYTMTAAWVWAAHQLPESVHSAGESLGNGRVIATAGLLYDRG